MRAGGGFGRRLVNDYDIEVARIANGVTDERTAAGLPSVPVKLLWTREDDLRHDQYRPAGFHYFKAGLDASGKLIAYRDFVGQHELRGAGERVPERLRRQRPDHSANVTPFGVPTGAMRAPPTNGVSFVLQGFIDEIGRGRRQGSAAVPDRPAEQPDRVPAPPAGSTRRAREACSRRCATMSGWNTQRRSLPKGTGMGVAFQFAHAGYFAYVVEVSVDAKKASRSSGPGAPWISAARSSTRARRRTWCTAGSSKA